MTDNIIAIYHPTNQAWIVEIPETPESIAAAPGGLFCLNRATWKKKV